VRLAAIDIGSNSIKLVVVAAGGADSFVALARDKEVVRLGHDTLRQGFLAPDAIRRAAESIARYRAIAESLGAEVLLTIATASVREAANAAEFVLEVERHAGVRVDVLSGVEEARLIGVAASAGCAPGGVPIINIDIGGGSTEISLVRDGEPRELFSVRLGAVGLSERFIASDPPKPKEIRALRETIRAALADPARRLRGAMWARATGTSGTALAVGETLRLRALRGAKGASVGAGAAGAGIAFGRLVRLNEKLAAMTVAGRRGVPGISAQRAEIIVAGGQILEGVMGALSVNFLRSCDYALREGVVIDYLRRNGGAGEAGKRETG
jgi:exopolyphosphatase / guanosine-5'-triphosphate,3'-diphosphate pyrophosphatase